MNKSGFTLIELLVVAIIMSVLTSIALPQYRRSMDRSKAAEAMQMLPALFEARERWVIENQCKWSGGAITSCDNSATFTPKKLDIETNGTVNNTSGTITTDNFVYTLVDKGSSSLAQACLSAKPRWGENRGLKNGATIWYRGDKFSCNGNQKGCDILNVIRKKNKEATLEYQGCI